MRVLLINKKTQRDKWCVHGQHWICFHRDNYIIINIQRLHADCSIRSHIINLQSRGQTHVQVCGRVSPYKINYCSIFIFLSSLSIGANTSTIPLGLKILSIWRFLEAASVCDCWRRRACAALCGRWWGDLWWGDLNWCGGEDGALSKEKGWLNTGVLSLRSDENINMPSGILLLGVVAIVDDWKGKARVLSLCT